MRKGRKGRRLISRDTGEYWISYSDIMSSMLLVFMLAVTFSIYQYYSLLETKTRELGEQQAALDLAQITLTKQAEELETTRVTLMGKEEELSTIQIQLDEKEQALKAAETALATKEQEQTALQLVLTAQQAELDSLQLTLSGQQRKLDELLGLRTSIVQELSAALNKANISANVDAKTGDIVLSSKLMFATADNKLAPQGERELQTILPVYLSVLLRPEYRNYLAEIIIEGHTDSAGSYEFNLELSQERALSVATYCLNLPGLTRQEKALLESILTVKGRSYADRIFRPDGTEDMEASRRVELKFRLKDTEMIERMNEILKGL
ncbi:MAG: OmpA family protein [Christensenellales bacterium]|jgi:chemotaxis protein MotB|nr:OmpA family protein [Clostridiales bacterium]